MVCAYFGIETGANSFGYVATWSKNAELPEFRASLDTISKTANGIITDVEKHFAEVCKERGIELPKDTEYELVTILPSRADALAFAAEYAAFLRRDLNVPDSADRLTAEAVADRLLAGEDTELRKELEDFVKLADEIGIDDGPHGLLERFNGLFRQEWRAKEEPQPEVETEKPNVEDELPPLPELKRQAEGYAPLRVTVADGWLIAAEAVGWARLGYRKILCVQPFACLPGHIFGKGQYAALQRKLPGARLVSVDYDASTGEGTVLSRIRMLLDEELDPELL